jgi:hypothetical protein
VLLKRNASPQYKQMVLSALFCFAQYGQIIFMFLKIILLIMPIMAINNNPPAIENVNAIKSTTKTSACLLNKRFIAASIGIFFRFFQQIAKELCTTSSRLPDSFWTITALHS